MQIIIKIKKETNNIFVELKKYGVVVWLGFSVIVRKNCSFDEAISGYLMRLPHRIAPRNDDAGTTYKTIIKFF
ncbi:hypothetical protein H6P87_00775 [Rickettsia tillamookensis]|uniref:Uncharacterized protein n=1 Tax=Rickettsia tillamookensis TaxID=2761623 RepID=A0A9E6MI26_9RICK|nr:hypothetical protein [Rickettsia tillamookensis]QQV75226.1 hypothetical protein H6P87_00775 [Rickettsia tillamookensis]